MNGRGASYRHENLTPVSHAGRWEFIRGDTELLPGVTAIVTAGMPVTAKRESGVRRNTAFFLGDLIPTVSISRFPTSWGMTSASAPWTQTVGAGAAVAGHWLLILNMTRWCRPVMSEKRRQARMCWRRCSYGSSSVPLRILIGKIGLDGHDRGVKLVASAPRCRGGDHLYRASPDAGASRGHRHQEDVHAIGLSIHSGAHNSVPRVLHLLREQGPATSPVRRRIIPDEDVRG